MSRPIVVFTLLLGSVLSVWGQQQQSASSDLQVAQQQISQGKFRAVLDELPKNPSDPEALMLIGIAEDHLGLYKDGNTHMKDALKKLPACASCWLNFGVSLSHLGQATEAAQAFLQAIRIDPKLPNAYFNLGQIYFDRGKSVDAARVLEKARRLAPSDFGIRAELAQSYFKSKNEPALERLIEETKASCGLDLDCQIRFAELLAQVGRADAAKETMRIVRESNPNSDTVSYSQALSYYKLGELDRAQELVKAIPDTAPSRSAIDELMGGITARRGDYAKAIVYFRDAAKIQPNERNLFKLAYTLYSDAQFEQAKQIISDLLHDYPSSARGYLLMGALNQELGQYPDSIEAYQKALSLEPGSAIVYVLLGEVLMAASDYQLAIGSFRKAVALNPGLPQAQFYLGLALSQSGTSPDLNEAVSHFRRAVKGNPSFQEAYVQLANALLQQRQPLQAVAILQRALAIGPESPQVHYILGRYYHRQGQTEKAEYHLKRFEELKSKPKPSDFILQQSLLTSAAAERK